ncbi:PAS domain S-box-containing protein/diguanylate cyclase (GGDEF)-like protein [Paucimonas lemoignei]|uniref:PAS domain S-box-containing protein/diguanylate cyclase (GGDEF)-like protein n=1 Tax=Paucimonas lemoignei TaxID=29443 RepID=A0A4V2UJ86_PAULE|nr:EAL domain-containing protein [Paucimonas lemoignei]TCS39100.1 PAS domain S-box-containing protein/diguanylate cyclase (GGDEF)-like protein [Paucimonas lemoignei]
MQPNYSTLLKQLKQLGAANPGEPPGIEQWMEFLEQVSNVCADMALDPGNAARIRPVSLSEIQELSSRIEETQRIAGLGDWSFDRKSGQGKWSRECYRIFGLSPSAPMPTYKELSRQIHRDDRLYVKDRVEAALHDARKFEIEFRYHLPDGEVRWVRAIGQPVKNARGQVCRLFGTVMDVNSRKLIEVRQSMEHTVARLLAECDSPVEVIPEIIETICSTFGWVCGALWMPDKKAGLLRRAATWALPRPDIEQFFHNTPDQIPLPAGAALSSRTLRVARADWFPDASRGEHFERAKEAAATGLHGCLAFPLQAAGEILGIMEFFGLQPHEADRETMQSAHFIGRHIGQFFQRKQVEIALRESEAHFRALVEQASDSFYVHDMNGRFIDVNQRGCEGLGYTREELLSMSVQDIDLDLTTRELKKLTGKLTAGTPIARESRYQRKDGSTFPVEIRMGPIDINGRQHLLSLVRDVTERKEMQDHIQHLAYHDSLTNLPNRAMFNRHLCHAIDQAARHGKSLAVLFIDLDRFKYVNDTLGHDAGDRLLQEMSRRLSNALHGDLVARLGGDEFVVLLEDIHDSEHVSHVAQKILTALVEELPLNGQRIHITASIGVSIFPEDGEDEFALMKHADIAMYRAKDRGKNNFQFYSAYMSQHAAKMLALESSLRRAIEREELVLYYQGKVETRTGRISGVESLVRWQHPELGLLSPDQFIPLAEETGLIVPLSKWVLREACKQVCEWQRQNLPPLNVAVNLSARQFVDDHLLEDTALVLRELGMDPTLLELEITESMMMHNPEHTIQILQGLKAMGIRIAIDDFGIGYSSLSHLRQFPIDIIKIDRSFIQDVPGDPADEAITEAIIAMGKSLKITVVAEGVEKPEQLQFLSDLSCEEIQGYFFSKPLPAKDFTKLLWRNLAPVAVPSRRPAAK